MAASLKTRVAKNKFCFTKYFGQGDDTQWHVVLSELLIVISAILNRILQCGLREIRGQFLKTQSKLILKMFYICFKMFTFNIESKYRIT